jgi:hypothetical protein
LLEFDEWIKGASKLSKSHTAINECSPENLRKALVELHQLVEVAFDGFDVAVGLLVETDIVALAEEQANEIAGDNFGWQLPAGREEEQIAICVCAQIRALDLLLPRYSDHLGPVSGPEEWLVAELNAYVIPRKRSKRQLKQGQGYGKRGLIYHRILPKRLNGYEIELIPNETLTVDIKKSKSDLLFGAGVFKNVRMKTTPTPAKKFLVTSVSFTGGVMTLQEQVEASLSDGCFGVVWPELCISPVLRGAIQKMLLDRPMTDRRQAPQVFVAGSWHEADGAAFVNRAVVFDGYGKKTLVYDKSTPYIDPVLGPEDIRLGSKLPIIVTDDLLIGFAICKDFCDLGRVTPYFHMNIDLVLVPSMGDLKTMKGHQNTAKRIQAVFGFRAFVVQQAHPPTGAIGIILPMLSDPESVAPSKLKQKAQWKSYEMPP